MNPELLYDSQGLRKGASLSRRGVLEFGLRTTLRPVVRPELPRWQDYPVGQKLRYI